MRIRTSRRLSFAAAVVAAALALTACSTAVDGTPEYENAANANLNVKGVDNSSKIDTIAQNSLSDIQEFWKDEFPKVSGGKQLEPLKGGLYSVDGAEVFEKRSAEGQAVSANECAQKTIRFLVNNGAFCQLDDSIVWDRSERHLFDALRSKYGDFVVAMIFAHEFGHAVQDRLGIFDNRPRTILTESQADCAAGAWAAAAVDQRAPHFRNVTLADVDDALEGYLNARDSTPESEADISHGNGFDRLSAVADGYDRGITYCYGKGYFDSRTFTSRPYSSEEDEETGGNVSFDEVVDTGGDNPFVKDLNRFWEGAAQRIGKKFEPVKIAEADRPKCGVSSSSEFGYCPDDNTVYFNRAVAERAYNSLPELDADEDQNIELRFNQPADFALGTLFSIGWGFAVRHQLFDRTMDDADALIAGVCYTGAYAKDINVPSAPGGFVLSPADLDESVSALLNEVPQDSTYGARGTTGLTRIQAFIKGYKGGLSVC